ncbi:hypothetical protein [Pseudomonas sp. OTU2001]|uniref:hypothetical protein n=1 Tax=Pseudomonas sp. OTU2001 TaxID=3043859 RepID=UPI00313A7D9F
MKTHELAKLLEGFSDLLKSVPDGSIQDTIKIFQKLADEKYKNKSKSPSKSPPPHIPIELIDTLYKSTPAEAEKILMLDSLFVSTSSLANLASILGIETSKRQNRNAIVNSIIRHLEARKIGSIIRNDTTTESKTAE